jgi:hypothetical protein
MIGLGERVVFAVRCFPSILFRAAIPDDIAQRLLKPAAAAEPAPVAGAAAVSRLKEPERASPETFDRAVQMLALLQRDGRLIDFLAENISSYPDAQLGAGSSKRYLRGSAGRDRVGGPGFSTTPRWRVR